MTDNRSYPYPEEHIPLLRGKHIYGTKLVIIADITDPQLHRLLDVLATDAEAAPPLKS